MTAHGARPRGRRATAIAALDVDARVADALGLPLVNGDAQRQRPRARPASRSARSAPPPSSSIPTACASPPTSRLAIGTLADLSGELGRLDDGFAATLDTLRLRHQGVAATLTAPATVTVRGGAVELTPLALDFGTGSLTAQGRVDESFDLDLAIRDLPLELANAVRPDLGLAGRVNGTARVTGPRDAPDVRFDLGAAGVASAATRAAGLPPLALDRHRRHRGRPPEPRCPRRLRERPRRAARRARCRSGAGDLDLDVNLQAFPLALVDRVAGNQRPARHRHRARAA